MTRLESYVRIDRVSRKTGREYKQWVFVGWSEDLSNESNYELVRRNEGSATYKNTITNELHKQLF